MGSLDGAELFSGSDFLVGLREEPLDEVRVAAEEFSARVLICAVASTMEGLAGEFRSAAWRGRRAGPE